MDVLVLSAANVGEIVSKEALVEGAWRDVAWASWSRLRGEPLERIEDIHFHPAASRTARFSLIVGF